MIMRFLLLTCFLAALSCASGVHEFSTPATLRPETGLDDDRSDSLFKECLAIVARGGGKQGDGEDGGGD